MLRVARPNTYKAVMPRLDSEFYDFVAAEDEAAGALLERHIGNLVHRARKSKLLSLAHTPTHAHPAFQGGVRGQWLQKLVPGARTRVPVFLPEDFISRVVRDVVRMAEGEHKGIRGCTLVLEVWEGRRRVVLGRIVCDPRVASSYSLALRMVRAAPPHSHPSFRFLGKMAEAIYISPGYTIEKTRLK